MRRELSAISRQLSARKVLTSNPVLEDPSSARLSQFKSLAKAHALTLDVYRKTRNFPNEEKFGLTSQLRRSCSSIPANLAEGCGRSGDSDFARFVNIAMGSACETDYHLLLSRDLDFLPDTQYGPLLHQISEVKRMLASFEQTLRGTR